MSIFPANKYPPEIRIGQIAHVYAGINRTVRAEYVYRTITLHLAIQKSRSLVRGLPITLETRFYEDEPCGVYYFYPTYVCECCKTSFIGTEYEDFQHDCSKGGPC